MTKRTACAATLVRDLKTICDLALAETGSMSVGDRKDAQAMICRAQHDIPVLLNRITNALAKDKRIARGGHKLRAPKVPDAT